MFFVHLLGGCISDNEGSEAHKRHYQTNVRNGLQSKRGRTETWVQILQCNEKHSVRFYIQLFKDSHSLLIYTHQKDAKVTWSKVFCLDISSVVTITVPSSHCACVVGPCPRSTCQIMILRSPHVSSHMQTLHTEAKIESHF